MTSFQRYTTEKAQKLLSPHVTNQQYYPPPSYSAPPIHQNLPKSFTTNFDSFPEEKKYRGSKSSKDGRKDKKQMVDAEEMSNQSAYKQISLYDQHHEQQNECCNWRCTIIALCMVIFLALIVGIILAANIYYTLKYQKRDQLAKLDAQSNSKIQTKVQPSITPIENNTGFQMPSHLHQLNRYKI